MRTHEMETLATMRRLCGALAMCTAISACVGEPDAGDGDRTAAKRDTARESGAKAKGEAAALLNELEALEAEARTALDAGDVPEASRLVRRGLARASDGGAATDVARGRFMLLRGCIARDAGKTVDARRDYADAMALFRVRIDDRGRFEVFLAESDLEEIQGDYAAAERQLAEAETLLPKIGDDRLRGEYQRRLGRLAFVRARYPDACDLYVEAIKSFSTARAKRDQAETLLLLAAAEDSRGDVKLARRTLEKALAMFGELADKAGEARALYRLAGFADRDRQFAKERSLLTKVQALYDELGRHSDAVKVERQLASLPETNE
jgi:tetratricopeptide (TPR) repeat protein